MSDADGAESDDKVQAVDAVEASPEPSSAQEGERASRWPWRHRKLQSARTLSLDASEDASLSATAGPIHTRWLPIVSGAC